jgi:tRNA pseudouridine55 synthase
MYSALKRDGKPLYAYAREGKTLEREARAVTIHELELVSFAAPDIRIRVRCSKGTYIRVLGEDIGHALGTGAHLIALRRIGVGNLLIAGAMTIDALTALSETDRKSRLLPADSLLSELIPVVLPPELASRFMQGQRLALGKEGLDFPLCGFDRVKVLDATRMLLGVARLSAEGMLQPERLVSVDAFEK